MFASSLLDDARLEFGHEHLLDERFKHLAVDCTIEHRIPSMPNAAINVVVFHPRK